MPPPPRPQDPNTPQKPIKEPIVVIDPAQLLVEPNIRQARGSYIFPKSVWDYEVGLPKNFVHLISICHTIEGSFTTNIENQVLLLKAVAEDSEFVGCEGPPVVEEFEINAEMINKKWPIIQGAVKSGKWATFKNRSAKKAAYEAFNAAELDSCGKGVLRVEELGEGDPRAGMFKALNMSSTPIQKYKFLYQVFTDQFINFYQGEPSLPSPAEPPATA